MKNYLLYKASQPSNPLASRDGGEGELLELGRWGLYGLAFCSNSAGAGGGGGGGGRRWRRRREGEAAKRQELAPIAIVNPLLAHGDILGLGSHKKSQKEIEIEAAKKDS